MSDLFARVLGRHEQAAAQAGVVLRADVGAGAEFVSVDRVRMEQALENLSANALRVAPKGSAVGLRSMLADGQVALLVSGIARVALETQIGRASCRERV